MTKTENNNEVHEHEGCGDHCGHDHPTVVPVRTSPKVGRNDPCICGSGKKYKKCCYSN
jgi:uncharacterized protein YecA (UPF0149 family)